MAGRVVRSTHSGAWPSTETPPDFIPRQHVPGTEAVCDVCECAPNYLTAECPGTVLTAYQKCRVGRGRLDYKNGAWIEQTLTPRFVGTFEEVTAFLNATEAK
jgi:hypothetical protein